MSRLGPSLIGPANAAIAVTLFSLNDVIMKFLSGEYALHQMVLIRSLMGLAIVLLVMVPLAGGYHVLRTQRLGMHLLRASFVVLANMSFFLGLAAMPLAEAVAVFFISPSVITLFSVLFLRERVGPWRWAAIALGLLGVLIILRPGAQTFSAASLFPAFAAICYAGLHMMTRYLRHTENAVNMTFYIQVAFIVICAVLGLIIGGGQFAADTGPSLNFLLRAWAWPDLSDLPLMLLLGAFASTGGYFISQAYRVGEAALVAPIEYLAMPLGIIWGVFVFGEWPDMLAWLGIALIATSGLVTVWRENQRAPAAPPKDRP